MSLTKDQLRASNTNSFPNNNSQAITPEILRDFNTEMIDSLVDEVSFSGSTEPMISSSLATASFDTVSRDMTFTKNDGTQFDVNIPGGGTGTADTGSLLVTASVSDATITYTKGDGSQFTNVVNAVQFATESQDVVVKVKNTGGSDLSKGTAVYATGVTGENINVASASNDSANTMPAIGLLYEDLASNASGLAVISGKIINVNTDGLTAGRNIYVNEAGGFTQTKPTGNKLIQNIGVVGKVNATEGEILIQGSGRSNDLPNFDSTGSIWVSNEVQVATSFSTSSIAFVDRDNTFTGTQSFDNISVSGTGSFAYIESVTGSAKIIGDAFIQLNTDTPAVRFGGVKVIDSGSGAGTGSFEYDSETNHWLYTAEDGHSAGFISGPTGSDKSNITHLTQDTIPIANGDNHLADSGITKINANSYQVADNLTARTSLNTSGSAGNSYITLSSSDTNNGSNFFQMNQSALGALTQISQNDSNGGQQMVLTKGGVGQITTNLDGSSGQAHSEYANATNGQSAFVGSPFIQIADQASGVDRRIILAAKASNITGGGLSSPNPTLAIATGGGLQEVFQFQDASVYTDGTVVAHTPMNFSGSITGSTTIYDETIISGTFSTEPSQSVTIGRQPGLPLNSEREFIGLPIYTDLSGIGGNTFDAESGIYLKGDAASQDAGAMRIKYVGGGGSFFSVTNFGPNQFGSFLLPSGSGATGYTQAFGQVQYPGGVPQGQYFIDADAVQIGTNKSNASIEIGNPAYSDPIKFNTSVIVGNPGTGYNPNFRAQIDGTITASLSEGYVWVGDSNNTTVLAATSSFGGGGGGPATVTTVTPSAGTATLDLSLGTKFYLDIPTGTTTDIAVSNRADGQSFSLLVSQSSAATGSLSFTDSTFKFAGGTDFQATDAVSSEDIISFEIYNNSDGAGNQYIYAASVKNLV